ncbi:MAG TPA: DNA repair protein [Candidatus Eremiobacteraeota bacterium]|nr:MAG: hypothetical protein BWY64_03618 [bacterium ADurb.Bin363]HPZ10446.1 DNA repair protein [Candidatus Eremiobacteraeota bacterium]
MKENNKKGHRERLRERFIKGEEKAYTEEALLELLLTYSIPQKDVLPLARGLLEKFGSLSDVLSLDISSLCEFPGIKISSATLLKLVAWLRKAYFTKESEKIYTKEAEVKQVGLFEVALSETDRKENRISQEPVKCRTVLFTKSLLKEAISMLPKFPDTEFLSEIKEFLRNNLHFNSQATRRRFANYIAGRLYPSGYPDRPLRLFALKYQGRQELRDVCFYRLCKAEPLLYDVIQDLLIPSIGQGKIERGDLRNYLEMRFPSSKSIGDGTQAVVEALTAANIARSDRKSFCFNYRQILLPSFAFILHNEFPEPGIYDIGKLENNRAINSMLWQPDAILTSLYELRNQGFISKISEIDSVRQFTTRWTLEDSIIFYP